MISLKFSKEIVDVIRHRLPDKHTTAWDLWVKKHPGDVIASISNLLEAVVCNTAGIGADQVGMFHAYVVTSQPDHRPAPTQFKGILLITF